MLKTAEQIFISLGKIYIRQLNQECKAQAEAWSNAVLSKRMKKMCSLSKAADKARDLVKFRR